MRTLRREARAVVRPGRGRAKVWVNEGVGSCLNPGGQGCLWAEGVRVLSAPKSKKKNERQSQFFPNPCVISPREMEVCPQFTAECLQNALFPPACWCPCPDGLLPPKPTLPSSSASHCKPPDSLSSCLSSVWRENVSSLANRPLLPARLCSPCSRSGKSHTPTSPGTGYASAAFYSGVAGGGEGVAPP